MKDLKLNTLLNIIKTICAIIFPIIVFPYASRILMPENIGKVNFGSAYISYFNLIATLGISTYAVRECSKLREDRIALGKLASELFSINLLTTVLSYILLFISLYIFDTLEQYRTLILIQSLLIFFTTMGADWLNIAMEDFKYITLRTIAFQFIAIVFIFLFVRKTDDYVIFAIIMLISSSGYNLVNIFYRKKFCDLTFTLKLNLKKHIKSIVFLFAMILSQVVLSSADITMLGLMVGDHSVGIYSTAYKITNLISQIVSSVVFVLIPRLSYLFFIKDFSQINEKLRKVVGFFTFLGIPFYVGGTLLAKEIILVMAGVAFEDSILILQILLLAFLFSLVGGSFLGNIVLLSSGKEALYMKICCIATLVNVVLNYLAIPLFQERAAAVSTVVASLLITVMLLITVDKRIQIKDIRSVLACPLIGSLFFTLYCLFIKSLNLSFFYTLIICVSGSILIYALVAYYLKNEIFNDLTDLIRRKLKGVVNG